MTARPFILAAACTIAAAPALAQDPVGLTGYALAEDGMTLITMADLATPDAMTTQDLGARLDAIAYRPVTGDLLGFSRDGMIVKIDPDTGAVTDLQAGFDDAAMIGGKAVAFDFNNAIDAVRAVGSHGANLVYFPSGFGDERAGSVLRFTDAAYADDDPNAGTDPMIFANAYTNAIENQTADSTFQYALDAQTDSLVSLANNAGQLKTIAPVTIEGAQVDLVALGGFDIVSPKEGNDMAFAILQEDGAETAGLYSLDLSTAEATQLVDLGIGGITGFALRMSGM